MALPCTARIALLVLVAAARTSSGSVLPALSPLAGRLLDSAAPGEDGQCSRDTALMEQAAANRTLWAVRMLDASAHVPSGVLWGVRHQLGSFDGCMSAGVSSPVGARYCLVSLRAAPRCPAPLAPRPWESVADLPADQDASTILAGDGMAPGSLPLGDVRVALCVPRSCGAAPLQAALQASLLAGGQTGTVTVQPEHCHEPGAHRHSTPATIFWCLLAGLTVVSLAAPSLGWSSWDWRAHVRSLSAPDPAVSGIDLSPLSGIRCLNALYLVVLHRGLHSGRVAFSNREWFTSQARSRKDLAFLYRGPLGVDTFFFLAGLLLSVSGRRGSLSRALANRIVRVVPVYAAVLLFHATALPDLGVGPLWTEVAEPMSVACRRWWWSNLLFINNYAHGGTAEHMCMEHSWSLAVDMHMFVVSTLLLGWLPAGRAGLAGLAAASLLSALPLFLATLLLGWPGTVPWTLRTLQGMWAEPLIHSAYTPTHMRAAPYLVGLLAGRALPLLKARGFRPSAAVSLLVSLSSAACMLGVMMATAPYADLAAHHSALSAALGAGLAPPAWAAALAVLVTFTILGEHTVLRSLLSWQPLVTLSRLTFAVYLVSYPLQALLTAAKRDAVRITPFTVIRDGFSDMVISFAISFWLFVVLEAPLRTLGKKMLSKGQGTQQPHLNENAKLSQKCD